jgi:hypothetical protein
MTNSGEQNWLLLMHQIPPKPEALRVKIWRRLQQIGAVAVKPSVYAMPLSDHAREDLSWTLKEIVAGGGDGSICEARFLEGLDDTQLQALFQGARKADYEKLIQDAGALLGRDSISKGKRQGPASKGGANLSRLRRHFEEISAIDFFQTPERATAELLLRELENLNSGHCAARSTAPRSMAELGGKTWVTRKNLFIDRIACGWLIRRFVDPQAVFKFVAGPRHKPAPNEIRFDMFDGEYTHEGESCSFEVMIRRFALRDPALSAMAQIVHDIDMKDDQFGRGETEGFRALLAGLVAAHSDDDERMAEGFRLYENLYNYFHHHKKKQ